MPNKRIQQTFNDDHQRFEEDERGNPPDSQRFYGERGASTEYDWGRQQADIPMNIEEEVHRRRKKAANRTEERRDIETERARERAPITRRRTTMVSIWRDDMYFATGVNNDRVQTTRPRLMLNTMPPHVARGPSLRQVAPPPHMCDCLRRVKTVRFMNGWRFTFLISRKRPFRERRRLETSPMALPNRPVMSADPQ